MRDEILFIGLAIEDIKTGDKVKGTLNSETGHVLVQKVTPEDSVVE